MCELVAFIAKGLVSQPDAVQVTSKTTNSGVTVMVRVDPNDVGRLIGRNGRVVKAIRSLLWVIGTRQGVRVNLEVD